MANSAEPSIRTRNVKTYQPLGVLLTVDRLLVVPHPLNFNLEYSLISTGTGCVLAHTKKNNHVNHKLILASCFCH